MFCGKSSPNRNFKIELRFGRKLTSFFFSFDYAAVVTSQYQGDPDEQNQKWQEEISTGFDRLVAYATEVDKRRKSCDSSATSPGFGPSGSEPSDAAASAKPANNPASSPPKDYDRMSALSMKFKRGGSTFGNGQRPQTLGGLPQRSSSVISSTSKRFAASSIPHDHDLMNEPDPVKNRLPGENLPEHHFKKRYFAQTRDENEMEGNRTPPHAMVVKKRPSLLGSSRQLSSKSSPDPDEAEVTAAAAD